MQQRFRLRYPKDFARLRHDGKAHHARLMIVSVAPNLLSHNRYGFITSKAVGNAVIRNRVRRQLREAIRYFHPQLKPGYDMVIIAKKGIVGQPFDQVLRTAYELFQQSNLMLHEGHNESL